MNHPRSRHERLRVAHDRDGGLIVYDERTDRGHVLNPAAAAAYQLADGTHTVDEIATLMSTRTGLPADNDIALLALDQLRHAGLLDADEDTPRETGIDRRALLTRLAIGAGAALLLPVVNSITGLSRANAQPVEGTVEATADFSGGTASVEGTVSVGGSAGPASVESTVEFEGTVAP